MIRTKEVLIQAYSKSKLQHLISDEEKSQLQSHLRKMYLDFEQVCNKHGLSFMVAYGNVIGAMRHKGFIPWDDDLDIWMPRDDYNKLIQLYSDDFPQKYKLFAPHGKYKAISVCAKLVDTETRILCVGQKDNEQSGIFIDIFPLENAFPNKFLAFLNMVIVFSIMYIGDSVQRYENLNNEYKDFAKEYPPLWRNYIFRTFIGWLFSPVKSYRWYDIFDTVVQYKKKSNYYSSREDSVPSNYLRKISIKKFLPTTRGKFDDIEVNLPAEPEFLLSLYYGDWKKIPPKNERWQHFIKSLRFNISKG